MPVKLNKDGPRILREAYKRKGLSQYEWARQANYTEIVVKNILRIEGGGPVSQEALERLCEVVDVDWRDVVENPQIEPLLAEVREKHGPYLIEKHGKIRVLDMEQPIGLDDVFIEVKVLEQLTACLRLRREELIDQANDHDFERWGFGRVLEEGLSGLDALKDYKKIVVLGKPGSGKTTFLRRVAILNIHGHFLPDHVPVFIPLADFAADRTQPSLLDYIISHWQNRGGISPETTKELLKRGRVLVLLDGLDEVKEADSERVIRSVEEFTDRFPDNHFVITCRIAAREYTFQSFTEVEVADFKDAQIKDFADKWFSARRNKQKTCKSAEEFLEHLQVHPRMQQLATSPLLLTLLCLVFEDSGRFMESRADLYKEGIDLLLFKWDSREHNLQRPRRYSGLGPRRIRSLLGQIAKDTLERNELFFRQRHIERWIGDFIRNLPEAKTDPEALRVDSHQVLKSIGGYGLLIERSQQLWSFSHLTFHEYFAAHEIVDNCNSRSLNDPILNEFVQHIPQHQWREVFLMVTEMLNDASCLLQLMKRQVDEILANHQRLQSHLSWIMEKSTSISHKYKPASVRAFYIARTFDNYAMKIVDESNLDSELALDFAIYNFLHLCQGVSPEEKDNRFLSNLLLGLDLKMDPQLTADLPWLIDIETIKDMAGVLECTDSRQLDYEIERAIHLASSLGYEDLKRELSMVQSCLHQNKLAKSQHLIKQLAINYRNLQEFRYLNQEERMLMKIYINANIILVDCLNGNCIVSPHVRQEIEETLLLPYAEIKARS